MPLNAWEPVIYSGRIAATATTVGRDASWHAGRRVDSFVYRPGTRTTDPQRVVGAKPAAFCRWVFDLLDARPGDEFVDVFPGSNGVARAWTSYASRSAETDASRSPGDDA